MVEMGCRPGLRKSAFILTVAFLFGSTALSSVTLSHALSNADHVPEFIRSSGDSGSFAAAETIGTKPTMGGNSWNRFGTDGLDEVLAHQTAAAMVSNGMLAAGYGGVAFDDACWSTAGVGSGNSRIV